ncbi:MAG TPA: aldehyde ferredoxin oxidoreductase C-terminal domain-containing protein, partial [Armatimonadota bacterium]|nr:aldehyde ferredoxin oxidoreductase C-terminal domain-containing protein [Armatimonadota bacterium]
DDFHADAAGLLRSLTGWEMDADELRAAGSRITTVKRLYNAREGAARSEDTLPPRLLRETLSDGPGAGAGITPADLDRMLDDYYLARGWNQDGTVPPALAAAALGGER